MDGTFRSRRERDVTPEAVARSRSDRDALGRRDPAAAGAARRRPVRDRSVRPSRAAARSRRAAGRSSCRCSARCSSPEGIILTVLNESPDPVTIAQVAVDDALLAVHGGRPAARSGRLRSVTLTIPYPWVTGEAHHIAILTSTGTKFEHEIAVALRSPEPDARHLLLFAAIGVFVGVIPVALGLLWFPVIRRMGRAGLDAVLAFTIGLLLFLLVDAATRRARVERDAARCISGRRPAAAPRPPPPISRSRCSAAGWRGGAPTFAAAAPPSGWVLSLLIAVGIGLHNLGEGLAIGAAFALGEAAFGTLLIIGFTLHNATEGLAIIAPMAKERPSVWTLLKLGLIGGVPTIAGAWIGGLVYSRPLHGVVPRPRRWRDRPGGRADPPPDGARAAALGAARARSGDARIAWRLRGDVPHRNAGRVTETMTVTREEQRIAHRSGGLHRSALAVRRRLRCCRCWPRANSTKPRGAPRHPRHGVLSRRHGGAESDAASSARGERSGCSCTSEDAGMDHDFVVKNWKVATKAARRPRRRGRQHQGADDDAAPTTYFCTPHAAKMRGTIRDPMNAAHAAERALDSPRRRSGVYVRRLFATIADRYDLITVLLSFGLDRALEAAADLAGRAARRHSRARSRLRHRRHRVRARPRAARQSPVSTSRTAWWQIARAKRGLARVPNPDPAPRIPRRRHDGAAIRGRVIRRRHAPVTGCATSPSSNGALAEIARVLRPGGLLLSLDFNRPANAVVRGVYLGYLTVVGSALGFALHRDPDTYRYIPRVDHAVSGAPAVARMMQDDGFDVG